MTNSVARQHIGRDRPNRDRSEPPTARAVHRLVVTAIANAMIGDWRTPTNSEQDTGSTSRHPESHRGRQSNA
ncbi:TPA: hypothetical protein QDC22_006996 [Burkholderia stabilis]|nr:hypothetical protein [Burkholderia stabilis]HDR9653087.1 hypothetical protein [Burkholderia stabilis]HDR9659935.1 hypothetical protein [Burkholderia stabilis]HDR9683509.1 hypothetical protein [Burkholderia stabilis]